MSEKHRNQDQTPGDEHAAAHEPPLPEGVEQRAWLRRCRAALADAAELRSLDTAAFSLFTRVPKRVDGANRILFHGWLESWAAFYLRHAAVVEENEEPLGERVRCELADHWAVLHAFGALFDIVEQWEEKGSWREHAWLPVRVASFPIQHGRAFLKIRATRSQLAAGYPTFERFTVPAGVTPH